MDDMWARGRAANLSGEQKGIAKLTEQQVAEVLQLLADGCPQVRVAERMGVTYGCISDIARGKQWRHVPGPRPTRTRTYWSRYVGVHKLRDKWVANIKVNGRQLYLGTFASETNAAIAYNNCITANGLDRPLNEITETENERRVEQ